MIDSWFWFPWSVNLRHNSHKAWPGQFSRMVLTETECVNAQWLHTSPGHLQKIFQREQKHNFLKNSAFCEPRCKQEILLRRFILDFYLMEHQWSKRNILLFCVNTAHNVFFFEFQDIIEWPRLPFRVPKSAHFNSHGCLNETVLENSLETHIDVYFLIPAHVRVHAGSLHNVQPCISQL